MLRLQIEGFGKIVLEGGGLLVTYIEAICFTVRSKPEHEFVPKQ